jgi:hypothetical protein
MEGIAPLLKRSYRIPPTIGKLSGGYMVGLFKMTLLGVWNR